MKRHISPNLENVYDEAKQLAAIETEMSVSEFPKSCPWKIEELIDL